MSETKSPKKKVAAIVGAGPGLGTALAWRFARESYTVGVFARSGETLRQVQRDVQDAGGHAGAYPMDATDEAAVRASFARLRAEHGAPDVCVYNAGIFKMAGFLETSPEDFEAAWRINCLGAMLCAREVLPAMLEEQRGTLLFTGATASLRGGPRSAAFASGKFGLRALAQSLAREFGPRGIHVAHVVIDGIIDTRRAQARGGPRPPHQLAPDAIAETYWQLHRQDPSAWTQELDLRPSPEKF
ncbi:SDR family NAD(P)-dependent oxidoreductase [Pyxidicoccus parkwayensis]|uniref:SDR family NAD(P)-dependent oxidoreductase n=1 Tax=Pyxidicoccus parkwayensis TaxID=2813578 RepID=A0ABX7NUI8_9BACT|nr:SDR family NAD(P)-dependent oxidoreductase [Pyxidicoccus parkwaysis]QSQ21046.1 SDR family NAD(P)-dependent oxidoreductase [Pyxidicoccus parkwaysis]